MQRSPKVIHVLAAALFYFLPPALAGERRDFSAIDRHALAAPPELKQAPKKLVAYLIAPAQDDVDKARAIFRWLTDNVEYDIASYRSGAVSALLAEDVLASGKAMCSGYATLFGELAQLAGLEVVSVHGYAKGFDYRPGDTVGAANHDWNAVRLQGRWQLIDSTWGAGGVDETGSYRRRFQPHYFLTDPAQLAYSHWPEERQWRLLDTEQTAGGFAALVRPTPTFFELGLGLGPQRTHTLQPHCNRFEVVLDVPTDVVLTATLTQPGRLLDRSTLVQREQRQARIQVLLPDNGEYRLNLYAKPRADKNGPFEPVLAYRIVAQGLSATTARLPESYVTFREYQSQLLAPLAGQLPNGQVQAFALTVPEAVEVAVVSADGQWFKLARNGQQFAGEALIGGPVTVVASFDATAKNYFTLLGYSGVAADALPAVLPTCVP